MCVCVTSTEAVGILVTLTNRQEDPTERQDAGGPTLLSVESDAGGPTLLSVEYDAGGLTSTEVVGILSDFNSFCRRWH